MTDEVASKIIEDGNMSMKEDGCATPDVADVARTADG
jgi:hypothetical protein